MTGFEVAILVILVVVVPTLFQVLKQVYDQKRRHADVVERLDRIEQMLSKLDR
jgi:hypothetical protein